ncbi:hypothetical protein BBK82_36195 [Lentzea guizhouensis]|uniref:Uncharacterized protein n=1 Tax=Lentzea guizhouensis TaxID=1586287 RepID=A0A1B2HSG9_9PSEU|nr:hypothetical protein [Lentzea guizhouensis]ANZ40638.1 hypothetical protein BBK82_36195 [Lentzea guizhouensis]
MSIIRIAVSVLVETRWRLSALNSSDQRVSVWPVSAAAARRLFFSRRSHRRVLLSPPPEARKRPSGENASACTEKTWSVAELIRAGARGSRTSHSRSSPLSAPVAIVVPSGEKATESIAKSPLLGSTVDSGVPVARSQSRTVPSQEDEPMTVPEALSARPWTRSAWPSMVRTGVARLSARLQTRMVRSLPLLMSVRASLVSSTDCTWPSWPLTRPFSTGLRGSLTSMRRMRPSQFAVTSSVPSELNVMWWVASSPAWMRPSSVGWCGSVRSQRIRALSSPTVASTLLSGRNTA